MALSSFWKRLAPLLNQPQQQPSHQAPPVVPTVQPQTPELVPHFDTTTVMGKISEAGRRRVLLSIRYNGKARLAEPYEFRGDLVFMFCSLHAKIHSFKIAKIEAIELTDMVFMPQWEIKV